MSMKKGRVDEEKAKAVYTISLESVRSIEEMAKLGMPFSILAKNQQTWLVRGGLDYFKNEKPYLYPLIEKLMNNRDEAFPVSLTELVREVAKRAGEESVLQLHMINSWVERIIRWKIEPFHIRSEKIRKVAKILKEVIEEKYKENPSDYKYLYKAISEWVKWNEKMLELKERK